MTRPNMNVYFKLFNNIKDEHEAKDLARLELEKLFGEVKIIRNFADVLHREPLSRFASEDIRIQDKLLYELPYGKIHGYEGEKDIVDLTPLVKRLGYTREIYAIVKQGKPKALLKKIFSDGAIGKNVEYYQKKDFTVFRIITHQYFLENSQYISKLSRNEEEIDRNVDLLFRHLISNTYKIPASSTMRVGKRLEDYFAIREEPSLYLTHYIHPYKGKFHPKMVRALLNYICPKPTQDTVVLDNFAGSGTLLLEATFMGINSYGVEINPLSVLMTNVKCHSLRIDPVILKKEINKYLRSTNEALKKYQRLISGQKILSPVEEVFNPKQIEKKKKRIPKRIAQNFKNGDPLITDKILICHNLLKKIKNKDIREFILLGLSGSISDAARRTKADFQEVLSKRLTDLYHRIYLYHKLNEILKIDLGNAKGYEDNTTDMRKIISTDKIGGIVNSPPYSTALDYIKFDKPQLTILGLTESTEELGWKMMGIPRGKYYPKTLLSEIEEGNEKFTKLPKYAKVVIYRLINGGRLDAGLRTYKFFVDIQLTTEEMFRVLKHRAKCAVIIGNNNYKMDSGQLEVQNDKAFWEMGKKEGFKIDKVIKRELEKSSTGAIRYESIVILQK